jgi:hypothetical protein
LVRSMCHVVSIFTGSSAPKNLKKLGHERGKSSRAVARPSFTPWLFVAR